MTVGIIGGLKRLESDYVKLCKINGYKAKVINAYKPNMKNVLGNADAIVLMTGNICHNAAKLARRVSKDNNIPLYQTEKCSLNDLECILAKCKQCKCKGNCADCSKRM